jgi:integrase
MRFTDVSINTLAIPSTGVANYWERPLGIRVTAKGVRAYIVMIGSGKRKTIGRVGALTLREARLEALKAKSALYPLKYKAPLTTLAEARSLYLAQLKVRPKTRHYYTTHLMRLPDGPLDQIDHHLILAITDKLKPSMAIMALKSFKVFFNWCVPRYLKLNPCTGLKSGHKTTARSRVLSDQELSRIWTASEQRNGGDIKSPHAAGSNVSAENAAASLPATFARIIEICILTGLRRTEASFIEKSWIKENTLLIPSSVTKNHRELQLPLGDLSLAILHSAMAESQSSIVFSGPGGITFNSWSKGKVALDKASGVTDWTIHDLRRTYASNLARIGINLPVIEKLLNHQSGSFGGIVGVYQRHSFMPEMIAAVHKYDEFFRTKILMVHQSQLTAATPSP